MNDLQGAKHLEYLWTSHPHDSVETIREQPPLLVSFLGVVQEKPRYIRDVDLKVGIIIQMVTTSMLKRGYFPRAADDFLLCEVDSQEDSQEATLTFVDVHTTAEDADAWITGASA